MLSRGLDIPEIKLVVNFDIPKQKVDGVFEPDSENYLHRVGRAGRFGSGGIAINLVDNDDDDKILSLILQELKCEEFQKDLSGPEEVKTMLEKIMDEEGI